MAKFITVTDTVAGPDNGPSLQWAQSTDSIVRIDDNSPSGSKLTLVDGTSKIVRESRSALVTAAG